MADKTISTGLRPITDDGPVRIRDTDISTVYAQYNTLRTQDPDREKRTLLLKSYCRDPYPIGDNCIVEGYGANYGELAYKVDTKCQVATDFLTERPTAFTITTNYREGDNAEMEEYDSIRHGELISQAFDKFFIKRWKKWKYNCQADAWSWNMWGKAFQYWPDPKSPHSMPIYAGDVYPDSEASMYMDDWDTIFIRMDLYAWQLWRMAQQDENLWDRKNLIYVLKYQFKQDKWEEQAILRGFNNQMLDYSLQNRKLSVVVMLVREYEPNDKGKQISRYIFPELWPAHTGNDSTKERTKGFLFRQPFAFEEFSDTLSMLTDQIGTGFFYNNPSFASSIYIPSYEIDRLTNKAMRGLDVSTMLILKAANANARDKIAQNSLEDAIILDPSTEFVQQRLQIPVGETMQMTGQLKSDMTRGTSSYEIGVPNPSGGSTPITARQNANDMAQSQGAQSMQLKWMNQNYGNYGIQLYKRFVSDASGETKEDLEAFKQFLKERKVPEKCWKPENVEVVSTGMQGAGNPQQRYVQATQVMDILDRVVSSKGAETAKRDALAALVGADKVEEYMERSKQFPTEQDRLIMMENAALGSLQEVPVRPNDYQLDHFLAHVESAGKDLQSAKAFLETPANDIDKGIDLNETANSLLKAQFKLSHAMVHLNLISLDPRYKSMLSQYKAIVDSLSKQAGQIEAEAGKISEAREKKLSELNGTDPEVEKQKALAEIEVSTAQQMSQIRLGNEVQKSAFNEDRSKRRAAVDEEIKVNQTATDIAAKTAQTATDLRNQQAKNQLKLDGERQKLDEQKKRATTKTSGSAEG